MIPRHRHPLLTILNSSRTPFSPLSLPGLTLWLDASDLTTITEASGSVSQWDDKSGNGYAFTQDTAASQPATGTVTQNGRNTLAFSNDFLTSTAAAGTFNFLHNGTAYTLFAVAQFGVVADPNARYGLLGNNATAGAQHGFCVSYNDVAVNSENERVFHNVTRGAPLRTVENVSADNFWAPNAYALLTLKANPSDAVAENRSSMQRNRSAAVANNTATGAASETNHTFALQIGACGNNIFPLTGRIAEIRVYNGALSATQVEASENDLAAKWGIAL
jgi:hypothetical protein